MPENIQIILILVGLVSTSGATAQTVLNGSFENHDYSFCVQNESNSSYSLSMLNSSAFGPHNTIDVLDSLCYGTAQDGNWFLWLGTQYSQSTYDAISLEMSTPLAVGASYRISYYDTGDSAHSELGLLPEIVEIGISTNDTTFGTLVYTSPVPICSHWTQRSFTFVASDTGSFITARTIPSMTPSGSGGTQLDNFSISTSIGVNNNLSERVVKLYPNPTTELINIEVQKVNVSNLKVQIINLYGQVIQTEDFNNSEDLTVNVSNLTNGVYFVTVDLGPTTVKRKFIKK